ncbi:nuclear transport factor 2 family protein [Pseudonocardia spinosispora]|uniref:nuclear transport factor 2 family protein n=1 Tax=Pseudonocardia spinosispora TaxID=103441 RepID=UPI0004213BF1|nr:nuclear transport factor 2 family protein [Pseudonocardia spinosispora]
MDPATRYATALAAGDPATILALFTDDASMISPFNHWKGRAIELAYRARARAFTKPTIETVLAGNDRAVVVWHRDLDGVEVRACDVLTLRGYAIEQVEIYIRPAEVLPAVHTAMTAAWGAVS